MADPLEEAVMITVVMVGFGQTDMTAEAVKSLQSNTVEDFQLVFVDNGSDVSEKMQETIQPMLGPKDIFIRNDVGRSFAKANNQGLAVADGEYILGLNNDTLTSGDWQTPLLESAKMYDLSGPTVRRLIVYDDLKLMMCHRSGNQMLDAEPYEPNAYVEGWCFIIKRDYFRELGGFDEMFWPMFCEDADLSFRVRQKGGKLGRVFVPIKHLGSKNSNKYLSQDYRDAVGTANAHKMYARWVKGALL